MEMISSSEMVTCTGVMRILMLSLIIVHFSGGVEDTRQINIYGINTRLRSWHGTSWLQQEIKSSKNTTEITICFFMMLQFQEEDESLILLVEPEVALLVENDHFVLQTHDETIYSNATAVFWRWTHICVLLGPRPAIYVDEKLTTHVQEEVSKHFIFGEEETIRVSIGKIPRDNTCFENPLSFLTTLPDVFNRLLSSTEITSLARCSSTSEKGELRKHWIYKQEVFAGRDHNISVVLDESNPLRSHPGEGFKEFLGDSGEISAEEMTPQTSSPPPAYQRCNRGPNKEFSRDDRMPPKLNNEDCKTTPACIDTRPAYEICGPPLPYTYFKARDQRYTYEDALKECAKYGGSVPEYQEVLEDLLHNMFTWVVSDKYPLDCKRLEVGKLTSASCDSAIPLTFCQLDWKKASSFELRWKTSVDPVPLQLVDDRNGAYFLSRNNEIKGDLTSNKIKLGEEMYDTEIRLGRMDAYTNDGNVSKIVISSCSRMEFTCNNGKCITLDLRCNGMSDCGSEDDSDESSCSILHELSTSYRYDRPPFNYTELEVAVHFIRIDEVNVNEGYVRVWLQMNSKWKDPRLAFVHLSQNHYDNIIPEESQFWRPSYYLPNALFDDDRNFREDRDLRTTSLVHRLRDGHFDIHDSYEVKEYRTGDTLLEKEDNFLVSYVCHFNLDLFPFDVHECHVHISVRNRGSFTSFFSVPEIYSEDITTSLFEVSKPRLLSQANESNITCLKLKFLLTRRHGTFIMTTFLPCTILGVIGIFTHCFAEDKFSDRIMVALSSLIVIASVFSASSTLTPNSAALKAVDIFIFFYIARLFTIFILHSVQGIILKSQEKKRKKRTTLKRGTTEKSIAVLDNKDIPPPAVYLPEKAHDEIYHNLKKAWWQNQTVADQRADVDYVKAIDRIGITLGIIMEFTFVCGMTFVVCYRRSVIINNFNQ